MVIHIVVIILSNVYSLAFYKWLKYVILNIICL
jgi:hypothetical protein